MTILRIDSSANLTTSTSRAATDQIVARLGGSDVITRDVAATALPHVTQAWSDARLVPADKRTPEERAHLALSDTLIAELKAADTLVIGAPIYNFGVPAALKAWIDLVARPAETFRYTENGPEGLLSGKRAIVVMASGGTPIGSDWDYASGYLRHVLGFIGITDVQIVTAKDIAETPEAIDALLSPQADQPAAA